MLIAAALAALMIIFGAPQNDLLILKLKKPVKQIVVDENSKAEILADIQAVKKLQKTYGKKTKAFTKQLKELVSDQGTDRETFNAFYDSVVEYEISTNKEFIPHRIRIQDNMTMEEWDKVIAASAKAYKKSQKSTKKALAKLKKNLDKMAPKVVGHLDDAEGKGKADMYMKEFTSIQYDFAVKILETDPFEEEVLTNKNATESELSSMLEGTIKEWISLFDSLSTLHANMAALATADEWKLIAKELKKII